MATRWFGPRPIEQPIGTGWPDAIVRHGSCGCCGCGGFYSVDAVSDFDELFTKYAAYRNGLRLKLTISGVPDSFAVDFNTIWQTEASGMSGYNGTWYVDIIRSQYGCIFNALDSAYFDVEYEAREDGFYTRNYTHRGVIQPFVAKTFSALNYVSGNIRHFSPDYYDDAFLPGIADNIHPMIGIAFEPSDSAYDLGFGIAEGAPDGQTFFSSSGVGWDSTRLNDVVSGDLRFYLSQSLVNQDTMIPDFTNALWTGTSTFWDSGTSNFKTAGTFTAEIERL
jgi:hypothetical protein